MSTKPMLRIAIAGLLSLLVCAGAHAATIKTVQAGATDQTVTLKIIDETTGAPETAVVFNTSGIDLKYWRHGANSVTSITEATQTISGAHADGGFIHLGDGLYRLDLPDAAVAASATAVEVFGTVTGMTVLGGTVMLSPPVNVASVTTGAIDNADFATAPGASGGLMISGTNAGTTTLGALTITGVTTHTGATTYTGAVTASNASNNFRVNGVAPGASGGLFIAGTNAATTITTGLTTTFTGNLTGSVGSVTGAVGSVTGSAGTWNSSWDAEVQSEVQDAVEVNHLDHLLAVDYDPASKPGVATALLNELVESDGGVSRFTSNALEQGPAGGGGSVPDEDLGLVLDGVTAQSGTSTTIVLPAVLSIADNVLNGGTVMIVSGTGAGQSRAISDWDSASDTATVSVAWAVNPASDSVVNVFGTAPTAAGAGDITTIEGTDATNVIDARIAAAQLATASAVTALQTTATAIEGDTAEIGAAGAGLTNVPWNASWDAQVESEVDDALGGGTGTALTSIPWNSAWDTEAQSEATDALNAYDPPTRAELTTDIDGLPTAAENATAVRSVVVEDQGSISLGCALAASLAINAGDVATTGGDSVFEDPSGTETRVTTVVVSAGNRTATITCPTY